MTDTQQMTRLHELNKIGQSIWLDYIRRAFLNDGGLKRQVEQGVRGVTSNPSIFEKAIAGSSDYDEAMHALVEAGKSVEEIYEALAVEDIQHAADILRPLYDESKGGDGYVSLEVSPTLANDTEGTIADARRLHKWVNRPNVMIKVPATPEGIPAIQTLIGDGININVTLMFSLDHYDAVAEAYISGLEKLHENGGDLSKVTSVASFFVSRVDSAVDSALEKAGHPEFKGKIAVANAKAAYKRFKETFSGERWERLASAGASVQRPLWASTGTKDPSYPDTLYIDTLIGPHTVNTVPPATLDMFLDHGTVAETVETDVEQALADIEKLAEFGIDFNQITEDLQVDGVEKFAKSFEDLMSSIKEKREEILGGSEHLKAFLGSLQNVVDEGTAELRANNVMARIWSHDHTVWKDEPTEITNRLGWLHSADNMVQNLNRIHHFVDRVRADGFTHVILLGMGGSSLAPEVFRKTYGVKDGYLELSVLDSTDPGMVLAYDEAHDLSKTLFIVSTKSGGTAETLSAFKYFYNRLLDVVGKDKTGSHFVAITDPGSKLEALADRYHFRATFLNDPNIGGRYSALSYFGIVPAALVGVDVQTLLDRTRIIELNTSAENCPSEGTNSGGILGAAMGELAKIGRDKVTLVLSPAIESFGDWVEQLIAESTGKEGKGILPVVGEPVGTPDIYGDDRLFVYIRLDGDDTHDVAVQALQDAGQPVIRMQLHDLYDLGGQFFMWEMATAVAGERLKINPFDQPNVESAKVLARKMIDEYMEKGKLPELTPTLQADGMTVYGDVSASTPGEALNAFLSKVNTGDYISLQAYVNPTDDTTEALNALRLKMRDGLKVATTVGYGPRFLHSTGQLHKGDSGNGLFIQFTAEMPQDVDIPDEAGEPESGMTFGTLKDAQALGDRQALLDENRRVITFRVGADVASAIRQLAGSLE